MKRQTSLLVLAAMVAVAALLGAPMVAGFVSLAIAITLVFAPEGQK